MFGCFQLEAASVAETEFAELLERPSSLVEIPPLETVAGSPTVTTNVEEFVPLSPDTKYHQQRLQHLPKRPVSSNDDDNDDDGGGGGGGGGGGVIVPWHGVMVNVGDDDGGGDVDGDDDDDDDMFNSGRPLINSC